MIKFRQKNYSSLGSKLSLGIENAKEYLREKKVKRLKKISEKDSSDVKRRAAKIKLSKKETITPRTKVQIKRDAINTRENIKSSAKNPKIIVKKAGVITDKAIQYSIKRPQMVLGATSQIFVPAAASLINPAAAGVAATLPIGTAINLVPTPNSVNKKLNTVARKYRATRFSKKLGGRI